MSEPVSNTDKSATRYVHADRILELEAQLAEARELLDVVVVCEEWFDAKEWEEKRDALLKALVGEGE